MKNKAILILVFLFCFSPVYALDWKKLHSEADNKTLAQASAFAEKNHDSIESLYTLGLVYLNLHRDKEAKGAFEKILLNSPDSIEAKWGVAEVLRRQHSTEESEKLLNEVIQKSADFAPTYVTLAYIKYTQLKLNDAVRLVSKVIGQGQENVDLSNYVRAYLIYGGTKGLIAHRGGPVSKLINGTVVLSYLKKAESLQPNGAGVLLGVGSYYLLAPSIAGGSLNKAEGYLKKAIVADPLLADAYVRLAQLYKFKGDNQKYELNIRKALEIEPKNELVIDIKSGECRFVCSR